MIGCLSDRYKAENILRQIPSSLGITIYLIVIREYGISGSSVDFFVIVCHIPL